jgi:hypothetical protein
VQVRWDFGLTEMKVPDGWKQALRVTMQRPEEVVISVSMPFLQAPAGSRCCDQTA